MSLETLQSDKRYQDLRREFESQTLNLNDPAFIDGRVAIRSSLLIDQMTALAVEHGWSIARQEWGEVNT